MPEDSQIPKMSFFKSRQRLDITQLTAEEINIEDIAHDLSQVNRFAGGTARPYSVGEHSLMVMEMVQEMGHTPEVVLQALMHDATEYVLGDIPAPVKTVIPEIRYFEQQRLWPVIAEFAGVPVEMHEAIKHADWVALYVEAHSLGCSDDLESWENYDKYWPTAASWMDLHGEISAANMPHPGVIEQVFLSAYHTLQDARAYDGLEEATG